MSDAWFILPVLYAALLLVGVYGWVCNIIAIAHASELTALVALRIVGIFMAPLGAVLGFI